MTEIGDKVKNYWKQNSFLLLALFMVFDEKKEYVRQYKIMYTSDGFTWKILKNKIIKLVVLVLTEVSPVSDLAFLNIMHMDMEPVMNPTTTMVRAAYFFCLVGTLFLCFLFSCTISQSSPPICSHGSKSLTVIIKRERDWFGRLLTEKSLIPFSTKAAMYGSGFSIFQFYILQCQFNIFESWIVRQTKSQF